MTSLSSTQQNILETAASRADGSIHPLPDHIKGGAAKKVIKALKNGGMIDDSDCITPLGRDTINPDRTEPEQVNETAATETEPEEATADLVQESTDEATENPGPTVADEATKNLEQPADEEASEGPLDLSTDEGAAAWNANMPADAAAYHAEMDAASEEPDGPDDYDDPPRSLFCPMDPADLPRANADEAPADADFEEDVTAAEQALAEAENPDILLEADKNHLRIARKHMPEELELVTPRNWHWIQDMLMEAYILGHEDAKKKKTQPPTTPRRTREGSKQAQVIAMLRRPEGATIEQISELTGWNSNTVRGAMAGALKKKLGLNVVRMAHTAGEKSTYHIED